MKNFSKVEKKFVLGKVTVIDPHSSFNGKICDILVENGHIKSIARKIIPHSNRLEKKDIFISPSWIDIGTQLCDPGLEHKETLQSGRKAALSGGFSHLAVFPNTKPVIENKQSIIYLTAHNQRSVCKLLPIVAVTENTDGTDLTEMLDLHQYGAIAFSDGKRTIDNPDILLKSLQYLQPIDALLIQKPQNKLLNLNGTMNEGNTSIQLGLKGLPNLAEEIVIARDISILKYTGGKLHFHGLSTTEGLKLIHEAKKLNVSCDIDASHLLYSDGDMQTFDSNMKVMPPYRSKEDRKNLLDGVRKGWVNCIITGHQPQDEESKNVAFDYASFGNLGLQTYLPTLLQVFGGPLQLPILQMAHNARKLLNLPPSVIEEGNNAELTLFNPYTDWVFDESTNLSLSNNHPMFGKTLKGQVIGVINRGQNWWA